MIHDFFDLFVITYFTWTKDGSSSTVRPPPLPGIRVLVSLFIHRGPTLFTTLPFGVPRFPSTFSGSTSNLSPFNHLPLRNFKHPTLPPMGRFSSQSPLLFGAWKGVLGPPGPQPHYPDPVSVFPRIVLTRPGGPCGFLGVGLSLFFRNLVRLYSSNVEIFKWDNCCGSWLVRRLVDLVRRWLPPLRFVMSVRPFVELWKNISICTYTGSSSLSNTSVF